MENFDVSQFKEMFLSEAREYLTAMNSALLFLEKGPDNMEAINEIFRVSHTLKGMAATMGYDKITQLTHQMENVLDKLRKKEIFANENTVEVLFECFDALEKLMNEISTEGKESTDIGSILDEINSILTSQTTKKIGVEVKRTENVEEKSIGVEFPQQLTSTEQKQVTTEKGEVPAVSTGIKAQSVRIKIEHLDKLMNLVGELVINKARLHQVMQNYGISEVLTTMSQFDRITTDLQEEVLKTRMVPVKQIFDRYPRMVRDLAKRLSKEVEFEMIGSEIEIDRTLLEEINEPLVHLLRNAIDHGLESPQEREQKGKPKSGLVQLIAKREKGFCIIEVRDDGKGMDVEEIKKKSVEKGIISDKEAEGLSEEGVFMLVCHPLFSTAKQITDISGRGVGMNVVKNLVESFNGKLEIISKKGEGSSFIIYLPLTLAIIAALLVEVKGEVYAIPLTNIDEIADVFQQNIKTIERKEFLLLREEVIPLIRLDSVFKSVLKDKIVKSNSYAIICEVRNKRVGFVVDNLLGQQQIVVKTFSGILKSVRNFSGATILGDGRVVLIIDIGSIYG